MLNNIEKIFKLYFPTILKAGIIKLFPPLARALSFKSCFAVLNITDRCCFRCIMCDQWKEGNICELTSEEWKNILVQLKENGIEEIILSGGEPFLQKDLLDIISFAKKIKFRVGIFTNGYLLERDTLDQLIELEVESICISLDGQGDEFDRIRGVKGAYEKVLNTCRLLSEYKRRNLLSGYLYFTLMKSTLNSYKSVFRISKELDLPLVVNLFDYTPYFFKSLQEKKANHWISEEADINTLKNLQRFFVEQKRIAPNVIYHTYSELDYFRKYFKNPLQKSIPCIVSQQRIGIDSQGNVYGGCWSLGSYGNLRKTPLKDIINSSRYKVAHRNMFFKKCPGCACGYSKNLRYYLPCLIKEFSFRALPFTRSKIWR